MDRNLFLHFANNFDLDPFTFKRSIGPFLDLQNKNLREYRKDKIKTHFIYPFLPTSLFGLHVIDCFSWRLTKRWGMTFDIAYLIHTIIGLAYFFMHSHVQDKRQKKVKAEIKFIEDAEEKLAELDVVDYFLETQSDCWYDFKKRTYDMSNTFMSSETIEKCLLRELRLKSSKPEMVNFIDESKTLKIYVRRQLWKKYLKASKKRKEMELKFLDVRVSNNLMSLLSLLTAITIAYQLPGPGNHHEPEWNTIVKGILIIAQYIHIEYSEFSFELHPFMIDTGITPIKDSQSEDLIPDIFTRLEDVLCYATVFNDPKFDINKNRRHRDLFERTLAMYSVEFFRAQQATMGPVKNEGYKIPEVISSYLPRIQIEGDSDYEPGAVGTSAVSTADPEPVSISEPEVDTSAVDTADPEPVVTFPMSTTESTMDFEDTNPRVEEVIIEEVLTEETFPESNVFKSDSSQIEDAPTEDFFYEEISYPSSDEEYYAVDMCTFDVDTPIDFD